jgi:1,4-dihydroxy-2-naphthoate octaprenyltransferase
MDVAERLPFGDRLRGYLAVSRPWNVFALPTALVSVGAAAAWYAGPFDQVRTGIALVGLMALHVAVNALNEASDYERGIDIAADPTPFSGGSQAIPDGHISARATRRYGIVAAAVGAAIGLWFLLVVGPVMVPVLVVGAVSVLGYTDLLARIGLGELSAGLGLGSLPVIGTVLVQAGTLPAVGLAAAVPPFFLTFNLLLLYEFPDLDADRQGGRTNLVILLGRRRAALLYALCGLAVPGSIVGLTAVGLLPAFALVAVVPSALLARPLAWIRDDPATQVPLPALRDNLLWVLSTKFSLAAGIGAGALVV